MHIVPTAGRGLPKFEAECWRRWLKTERGEAGGGGCPRRPERERERLHCSLEEIFPGHWVRYLSFLPLGREVRLTPFIKLRASHPIPTHPPNCNDVRNTGSGKLPKNPTPNLLYVRVVHSWKCLPSLATDPTRSIRGKFTPLYQLTIGVYGL
jgi:hypothetical protein